MINNTYLFKYRRFLFWRSKKVMGHKYEIKMDKMVLYKDNGGIEEISSWSKCECKLGTDWVVATKDSIKDEAGQ